MTALVTSALPLYHHMRATIATLPRTKSRERCASATPMSARSTRSGDACPKRLRGGHAKNIKHTAAVTPPINTGFTPAAPGSTGNRLPSTRMKASCSIQPSAQPISVPHSPIQNRLRPYRLAISGDWAPRLFRMATYCVCRSPKRRLANVIAAAASTTAREPASSKNPCALSNVSPILGCAPSTESNRWPCPNCGSTHSVNAAIASDVPLSNSRYSTRLPG